MKFLTPYRMINNRRELFNDFDRMFEEFMPALHNLRHDEKASWIACDMTETPGAYQFSFDIPGMKKEEIKIELHDGLLTVSGERKKEEKKEEGGYCSYEKTYGYFQRSFRVPSAVADDKVEANYQDGVLKLTLPKTDKEKAKVIKVI